MLRLRAGGRVARTVVFLRKIGRPATIPEIMLGIGEPDCVWRMVGLRASISAYAVKGRVFTRPGNTVALLDAPDLVIGTSLRSSHPLRSSHLSDRGTLTLRNRARVRLYRNLSPSRGVMTPYGIVHERPTACQWCGVPAVQHAISRYSGKRSSIEAVHFLPYGPAENDLILLFACPICHHGFEIGEYTAKMIADRFSDWWAQLPLNQPSPQI